MSTSSPSDLGLYFQGVTAIIGVVVTLYIIRHDKKIDKIDEDLSKKDDSKDVKEDLNKIKEDFKQEITKIETNFKSEISKIVKECINKRVNCTGSTFICNKIDSIKNSLEKQMQDLKNDIINRIERNETESRKSHDELWNHGNFHSHTHLPNDSEVIKRKG